MSAALPAESRGARLLAASPVLAALLLHALAHGRSALAAPAAAALLWVISRGAAVRYSLARFLVAGIAGALASAVLSQWSAPPLGPIPPLALGPVCGFLLGAGVFSAVGGRRFYSWLYAAMLVVLSAASPPGPALFASLALVGLSLLAAALADARVAWAGAPALLAFAGFAVVTGGATLGVARAVQANEGRLVDLIGGAISALVEPPSFGGVGLGESMALQRTSTGSSSSRALLAVSPPDLGRLRAVVFDHFDGRSWSVSAALARSPARTGEPTAPARAVELTLLRDLGPQLPAPAGAISRSGDAWEARGAWLLRFPAGERRPLAVSLVSSTAEQLPPEEPPVPEYTNLPQQLQAALEPLARPLLAGAAGPLAQAAALERFFHENFTYSLESDLRGKGHPLVLLITERRPSYCIFFASAMAALLRSVGTPARVVGGFLIGDQDPLNGRALIRERDAHAWVEVWSPEQGRWLTFDPTPAAARDRALGIDRAPSQMSALLNAVRLSLLELWSRLTRAPLQLLVDAGSSPYFLVPAALFLGWLALRGRTRRQGLQLRAAGLVEVVDPRLSALYRDYTKLLRRKAGLVPGPAETDDELLARLAAARGAAVAERGAAFVASWRRARWGGQPADDAALQAALGALGEELEEKR